MKNSFLHYYQQILDKVSFDLGLMNKEYKKALLRLEPHEVDQLQQWLDETGLSARLVNVEKSSSSPFHRRLG